ncbi:MAG: site-specific DNA-methyltransferase [Chloroflexus sp.]|nr:site-specific DNA-methyltransferase [Chloroflexus sp.]
MSIPPPIHPFPARMAPSIALQYVQQLPVSSVVLDPMMGSGTVVRAAADAGHRAIGVDVDPLAVLMAKVWTTPIDTARLPELAAALIAEAQSLPETRVALPWIDDDAETRRFVEYWFAPPQRDQLRRLGVLLAQWHGAESDALRIALSRTIITKDHGASLARDVSHSRPHRAFATNDYDVFAGFAHAAQRLAKRLEQAPPRGNASVALGDARQLDLADQTVDAVITSPPYLNAIDYLRGHRLALVWFGYQLSYLRAIRATSIGAERAPDPHADTTLAARVMRRMGIINQLPPRQHRLFERYVLDLAALLREIQRVLKAGGQAVFVLGNSCVRGVFVRNSVALSMLARDYGFVLAKRKYRDLPEARRYLPPPTADGASQIERRMRKEVVLAFTRV